MKLTKADLEKMDESSLLNFIVAHLSVDQKHISPEKHLCGQIPVTIPTLINWKCRKGAPSLTQLLKIYEITKYGFIKDWVYIQYQRMR